ncbi:MAG: transposase [Pseudomonadota bacterium]|nr:transposase [Pseudomonadota bacterium]
MARPLRLEFAGALYHVTSRGDRQEDIFRSDGDRQAWQRILASVCARFRWHIHAFCQMGNHYHLVVETLDGNLARGMRQLNGEYTQRFNLRNATVGHLFQGRYHAILVQRQTYLLELSRYVVLNPVRAGMVAAPNAWPWSSYSMTCGDVPAPEWLAIDWLLSQFAAQRGAAVHAYREFVAAGRGLLSPMAKLRHNLVLGDEEFVKQLGVGAIVVDKTETSRPQKKSVALALHQYRSSFDDRRAAMAHAYLEGPYTMAEIAEHFSVHYKTVSRAVRDLEAARCANVRPDPSRMSDCQT